MTKPKKAKQWKLKGWVAVLDSDIPYLGTYTLAEAGAFNFWRHSRAAILEELEWRHLDLAHYLILRLDVIATAR